VAQVASDVQARIDHFLDYCIREWDTLPEFAEEFATWGPDEQLVFVLEWPIREDGLHILREYAERGLMTPEQRARHVRLLQIVERNRPIAERLFSD
jgi:hypothetical protein